MINIHRSLITKDLKEIGGDAFLVLLCLANFMNAKRSCFPNNETIQTICGIGRNRVRASISKLEQHGYIKKTQFRNEEKGTFKRRSIYIATNKIGIYVNAKNLPFTEEIPMPENRSSDATVARETVAPISGDLSIVQSKYCKLNNIELFESFRKSYPATKRGLQTELRDFEKRHGKNVLNIIPILSEKLKAQQNSKSLIAKSGGFVPQWKNLKTYLNQNGWEEEYTLPSSSMSLTSNRPEVFTSNSQL